MTSEPEPFSYGETARLEAMVRRAMHSRPGPPSDGIQVGPRGRVTCECERCLADLRILTQRGPKAYIYPSALVVPPEPRDADPPQRAAGIRHAVHVDSRARDVTLRAITDANRRDVERLAVTADQGNYVAGVAESLLEAAATPAACPWYRAVYARHEPVGFVMLSDGIPDGYPEYLGPYFLWRLLIDARWQGQGLGTAALDLVVAYVRTRPHADKLLTSVVPGPTSPMGFYLRYGFSQTGQVFDEEDVLELPLAPPAVP